MTEPMTAYRGFERNTEVTVYPIDRGCGAGEVPCFECGGDGDWTKFAPAELIESYGGHIPCIDCKGTGRVLIAI